jgi:hypothetical protein
MDSPREQLELLGLDEALRRAEAAGATPSERKRLRDRLEAAHSVPGRGGVCATSPPSWPPPGTSTR